MDALVRDTLQHEGRWLDDECVMQLSQAMLQCRQLQHSVALVDSLALADWLRRGRSPDALAAPQGCRLQLMPVHDADHWSLLVRCHETRQWIHMDSLGRYHARYVTRLIDALDAHYGDAFERHSPRMVPQATYWECGLYLLMYAWMVLHWAGASDQRGTGTDLTPLQHIEKYKNALCEETRPLFTAKLLALF